MSCKIAIMGTRGIPNHYGGFEQLAEYLAPGLVEAGHRVTVYNSHNHAYQGTSWKGVTITHCYDPSYLLGSAGQFIYDLNCLLDARKRDYDVILQLGYTSSSIWGRLFPENCVTLYNLDGLEWQRAKYSKLAKRFLLYAEKLAVAFSDDTIADSPVIQSYFRDKYGIAPEYIAYGAEVYGDADEKILEAYGVQPDEYCLLMARMEPENNVEMVLEGFSGSTVREKMLVIGDVGNGFGRRLTARFGADERIIFAGAVYEPEKLHSLKQYCRFYFHGHSTGGTNPSLLEAMASEAFVAAHNNAFNREVLGGNAVYFSTSGEIRALVDGKNADRGTRKEMLRRNREKIEARFGWPTIISQYERFILQAVAASASKRSGVSAAAEERSSKKMPHAASPTWIQSGRAAGRGSL